MKAWTIPGSDDKPIIGNAHVPGGNPVGVVLIAHGFKGYKDYGMFPAIAETVAEAGFIAHRFNFSHSGMTNNIETFERPDLFERDTWNKQVIDYRAVIEAVASGVLDGQGLPYVMFGHSRGGVSAMLTAGRFADDQTFPQPAGVITAAAPCACNSMTHEQESQLLADGRVASPSSRTGQTLHVSREFLTEQQDNPAWHDVLTLASMIHCPMLILHGEKDPTVPVAAAEEIAAMTNGALKVIGDGDHVFNTPNPKPPDKTSPQLRAVLDATVQFAAQCCLTA